MNRPDICHPAPPLTIENAEAGISRFRGIQLTGPAQVSGVPGACCSGAVQARWVAAGPGRNGPGGLGLRVDDQVAVAHRTMPDGEFEDAVEDHASAGRAAAVEAEGEFVQVALQASAGDRTTYPRSPLCEPRRPRTCSGHHRAPSRRHARSADRRSRPASAATPGSPSSRHRSRTRTETRRSTSGSARRPAATARPLPQLSPVS